MFLLITEVQYVKIVLINTNFDAAVRMFIIVTFNAVCILYLYYSLSLEAHPNKFTVGMLETPLRVGVPFQV